ncbi:MAG: ABC transporter permease [Patescibacteria group bacterium]
MSIKDLTKEIFWSISGNKARSFLTILGIVIGIASVIALISLGQGAKNSIQESIQSIGSNLILVQPGAQRSSGVSSGRGSAQTLVQADADAIKDEVTNIKGVAADVSKRYQVTAGDKNTNTSVVGTEPDYSIVRSISIDSGSFVTEQQVKSTSKIAILGPTTRDDLFGENADAIGKTIRINGVNFKVVGITKAKGGSGFNSPDDAIYIPITTAQRYLSGNKYLSSINVAAQDEDSMVSVQTQVNNLLLTRHKISDSLSADFSIINQNDIVSAASSITSTLTTLLAGIAGISLLVGGIGIMNMMLITVTERTREIGLRKAIGAKKKNIITQFLFEAIMLTFLGGIFGIILGWLASLILSKVVGITGQVTLYSILLAFGVSAAVGIIFGYYPARRAASLNPIEALRYE